MTVHRTYSRLFVNVIESREELNGLENTWNALLQSSYHNHIFVSFEWISAWWKAFGKAHKLFVITVANVQKSIVAIAPLMKTRRLRCGLPVRDISFIYNDNASRTDLIVDKDYPLAVNEIIGFLNAQSDWDTIEFPNVWRESKTFSLVVNVLNKQGCRYAVKDELHSLYIKIESDWDTYYASRSNRLRKHLRNSENRIKRVKDYSLQCVRHIDERPDSIQQMCAVSEKSWKALSNSHIGSQSDDSIFFNELTRLFSERKWLNLWILDLERIPVAYDYHVHYNDTVYALRSDYDERYAEYSPGTFVHQRIIKKYIGEPGKLREYEFCGHDEDYKTKWTTNMKEHGTIIIYRNSVYGILLYLLDYQLLYRCKQLLKKIPLLKKLKKIVTRTR